MKQHRNIKFKNQNRSLVKKKMLTRLFTENSKTERVRKIRFNRRSGRVDLNLRGGEREKGGEGVLYSKGDMPEIHVRIEKRGSICFSV